MALAYFSADDHWQDDRRPRRPGPAPPPSTPLRGHSEPLSRQCRAMETCIRDLRRMEAEHCPNPDLPANCFGLLMAELFCWREDRWSGYLRQMAMALGRFIYFVDAAVDYRRDLHRGSYNPFRAMGGGPDPRPVGKIIWFWKWDGPPRPTKCYPPRPGQRPAGQHPV